MFSEYPLLTLFAVIASGLLLGSVSIKGISLGSSGVLFTALLAGHLGYSIPGGVGALGLALFVYCIGIGAGGRFFPSIARDGADLAKLALFIVGIGGLIAYAGARLLDLPPGLACGIFAGALTSTPALAAASESLAGEGSAVSIGYGIAYPAGVVGIVLFVQLLPRISRGSFTTEKEAGTDSLASGSVQSVLVEVGNPQLFGQRIADSGTAHLKACQISRILKQDELVPLSYEDCFEAGLVVQVVGSAQELPLAVQLLGKRSERHIFMDVENERRQLLVTERGVAGQTLASLAPLKNHGVVVTRINRLGFTFVPNAETRIEINDSLTVVGQKDSLLRFGKAIGHRDSAIDATDLLSLSAGLSLGILAGHLPFGFPGGEMFTLGLAGGPLLVALVLGHIGRFGRITGHIPRPTRLLLQDMGLVFFLAESGTRGGVSLVETLSQHGPGLVLLGVLITFLPLACAWPIARKYLKLGALQSLGGISGSMTSTPALGAITEKHESQVPVVSYVAAYPVALIVTIVVARILIGSLS